jgi:hypothetical protein
MLGSTGTKATARPLATAGSPETSRTSETLSSNSMNESNNSKPSREAATVRISYTEGKPDIAGMPAIAGTKYSRTLATEGSPRQGRNVSKRRDASNSSGASNSWDVCLSRREPQQQNASNSRMPATEGNPRQGRNVSKRRDASNSSGASNSWDVCY